MAATAAGEGTRRPTVLSLVLCAAPVVVLLALAWARRWTADDGFINLRVVQQLAAGHGPVFNPGERVEIGTSPAWIALVFAVSRALFFVRLEWVALVLSLVLAGVGVGLAQAGARALHGHHPGRVLFPAAAVVLVALPPVWDFATSGLEVGLSFAWLGGCFAVLARRRAGARAWPAGVLVGLGPLVRPDFALFSAAFLVALLAMAWPGWRRAAGVAAAGAMVPVAYEVFRMAYYAALVPNTAFAKEAARAHWSQGWFYLGDFVGAYVLWVPLALVLALLVVTARRDKALVLTVATTAAAALHWLYVARVGGDFMHGRMLLPGLFDLTLPIAVVPVARWHTALLAAALVAWAVVAGAVARPHYDKGIWGPRGIANERAAYVSAAGHAHPVTTDDYRTFWPRYAQIARRADRAGQRVLFLEEEAFELHPDATRRLPLRPGLRHPVLTFRYVGMLSYASGADITVVDRLGLGDPIGSRIAVGARRRPGHEKELDLAWVVARYAEPALSFPDDPGFEARVVAARAAVRCGPLGRLLDAVSRPLTARRMAANARLALTTYGARVSGNPVEVRAAYC